MQYVITVDDDDEDQDEAVLYSAPVAPDDAEYLQRVLATLRPLSSDDYRNGPAFLVETGAHSSYVLHGQDLLWCIEFEPGLIVVRCSPSGELAWTAIRSPVPNFGGREASEEEMAAYDEDQANPQYNLIFKPWDAQFDEEEREASAFVRANSATRKQYEASLAQLSTLHDLIEEEIDDNREEWANRCEANLTTWCGEGIRLT